MLLELWRRVREKWSGPAIVTPRRATPRNHIEMSSACDPPTWLLRELRRVDPLYDLHYLGNGTWVVGRVVPNRARERVGGLILRRRMSGEAGNRLRSFARWAVPYLVTRGFGCVELYDIQGEPDSRILNDVREREWRYRHGRELEFERGLAESEHVSEMRKWFRTDGFWDEIEYRDRHARPVLFRGLKHFGMGRMKA